MSVKPSCDVSTGPRSVSTCAMALASMKEQGTRNKKIDQEIAVVRKEGK
jgi:hypothetical protein